MCTALVTAVAAASIWIGCHLHAITRAWVHGGRPLCLRYACTVSIAGAMGLRVGERHAHQLHDHQCEDQQQRCRLSTHKKNNTIQA